MLDKPLGLVVLLVQSLFAGRRARAKAMPKAVKLRLECLEERQLLATFTWTGGGNTANLNWSNPDNWSADGGIAKRAPRAGDDVFLDNTGFAGNVYNSVVDPDFIGGTVGSLT